MAEPKQVVYTPIDMDDATYGEFSQEPTEDELEFQKFKDEFKQANEYAKVSVYRQPTTSDGRPGQKALTFLFEAGVEEFSFSQLAGRLRDEYGTGTYRIQLRDKENKLKMNRGVHIEAPKSDVVANPTGDIIDRMSRVMAEQQNRTESMFRSMSGPQSGGDAFDQMTKMMAAMGSMMGAMGIQPQPAQPQKTLIEQLTEFKLLKELMGESSEGGGEANLYSLLGKTVEAFGGPIAAAIAAGADSGELSPEGVAALPAPLPENPSEVEMHNEAEAHKLAMRKNIHILIQNAKTGIPPQQFALILINNTPAEKEDDLWNFISAENCVDEIVTLEPAAEGYREWFETLRNEVINLMSEDELPGEKPIDESDLPAPENGSTLPDVDAVAGGGELPHDPDNSDTSRNS